MERRGWSPLVNSRELHKIYVTAYLLGLGRILGGHWSVLCWLYSCSRVSSSVGTLFSHTGNTRKQYVLNPA